MENRKLLNNKTVFRENISKIEKLLNNKIVFREYIRR